MFRLLFICLTLFAITLMSAGLSHAAWLWSPESGKWTNTKDVPEDTPEAQFFTAKKYFDEGDYKRSNDEMNKLIKHYPHSRWAAEAQFFIGQAYDKMEDVGKAAEAYKTVVDRYPYSERLNDAIEREFELAEMMMEGKKTKFLGMEIMPAEDVAADLYRHIVQNAPYGPYGATAQFRLADAELAIGNFEEAERAYQSVIDEYPNSEYSEKAKYRIAQITYDAAFNEEQVQSRADEAIKKYEGFKSAFPESYLKFEADEAIQALRNKKAKGIFETAVFYHERKKYTSARLYYQDIVDQFSDTDYAEVAKGHIEDIQQIEQGGEAPPGIFGMFRIDKEIKAEATEPKENPEKKFFGLF